MRIKPTARIRDQRVEDQIREIQRQSEEPPPHAKLHAKGGADALTASAIGAETPTGAQAKADAAAQQANANLAQHTSEANPHAGSQAISGGTERPLNPAQFEMFFDTNINKPIWWTGSIWVDATGTQV